tara:strand:- start:40 stop:1785 length:1746 start_codon:yes stop_codon:yes gene_type:complete
MYQAQAQVTDITPVLQAATSSISNITNAITEKRKDQEERSEQEVKTNFINIIKNNPNISPDLVKQLNNTQDQYFDALKRSENLFLNRDKRDQAAADLRNIEGELAALEKSLVNVDLKRAQTPRGEVSNWNNTVTQAEDVMFHDDTMLAKNIMFEDRVAYLKTAGYNEEESFESNVESKGVIRLDEYKPPMTKYTEAILDITSKATSVQSLALQNGYVFKGSSLQNELVSQMRAYLDTDKGFSLLADNIGNFNWLDQQLLDPREGFENPGVTRREDGVIEITDQEAYDNNIEKLKERVKNDEKRYKQEFIDDYNNSLILINEESVAKYEAKQQETTTRTGESRTYNTALGYYDKNGLRGLVQGVKDGFVSFGKDQDYRKFEDGKFYLTDTEGNKLSENDKGLTENEIFSKLRVTGYLDMFDFGTAADGQEDSGLLQAFNLSQQQFDEFISGDMPAENQLGFARSVILMSGIISPEEMKNMTNEEIISMVKEEYQSFMDIKNAAEKRPEKDKDIKLSDIADTISSTESNLTKDEKEELERIERRMKELVEYHGSSVTRRTNPLSVSQAKYSRLKKKREKLLNK